MGKGDKRTRRGKIFKGTYGARRPHRPRRKAAAAPATKPKGC
ncbi:MAG: 30S ribosomal protein THX [Pseudomonadota bacterium]